MNLSMDSVLSEAKKTLKSCGIERPGLEVNILLEHCVGCSLEKILAASKKILDNDTKKKFFELLERRVLGEPLDYVCERSFFYSKEFAISKGVFIPRSDTEVLVRAVLVEINNEFFSKPVILDMCSGSGCVGLTLAAESECKMVYLADKSAVAVSCAVKNQKALGLERKTKMVQSDLFGSLPEIKFEYIVSNPPYVSKAEFELLDKSVKDFEPREALLSPEGGFSHIKKIAKDARSFLRPGGKVFFEVGASQGKKVCEILVSLGYDEVELLPDLNKIDRVVVAKWKN